ncbi:MAG: arylsulfatase [Planctomycetota bacterium]
MPTISPLPFGFALLLAAMVSSGLGDPAGAALPNVVVIYADDLGYGDLSCQNAESKIRTPNLDRLASEGTRFTDAHSSSGICTPSRYALLTGRYHWRKLHGIVGSWGASVIAPERLTLPEMLRSRGYRTACIGKWHLGFDWSSIRKPNAKMIGKGKRKTWPADAFNWEQPIPDGPLAHGFDYYFGDDVPNFPPYAWIENDRVLEPPTVPYRPSPMPSEGAPEGRAGPMVAGWQQDAVMPRLTEKVVEWIADQRGRDEPFFLYWPWTSPHAPIVPTADWLGKSQAGPFGDFVMQSDAHAGRLLDALYAHGLADNTLVIFTADNGPERYAFERLRSFDHSSSGPLRGLKRDIWEGGHRVPMIVRWPGEVAAGAVSDGLMSQIDIMATLAGIVGADLPAGAAEDSHDQQRLWRGGPSARGSLVHNTYADKYALRAGPWLLINAPSGSHSRMPAWFAEMRGYETELSEPLLFNLDSDLGQRTGLSEEQPQRAAELKSRLEETRAQGEVRPLATF